MSAHLYDVLAVMLSDHPDATTFPRSFIEDALKEEEELQEVFSTPTSAADLVAEWRAAGDSLEVTSGEYDSVDEEVADNMSKVYHEAANALEAALAAGNEG